MAPQTVRIPTQVVVTYIIKTMNKTKYEEATVLVYYQFVVNSPTTITSFLASSYTTIELIQGTRVERIIRTMTSLTTITFEEIYTSTIPPTPEAQTGFSFNVFSSNFLLWLLIIIVIILAAALAMRSRHPKTQILPPTSQIFCVNCGTPIPSTVKYCPQCGGSQR